jgi:hypothetical protein
MLDYEYWLRLGLHGRFVRIPKVFASYRVHPGSQSFAATAQIRPEEPVKIIEQYFDGPLVPAELKDARSQAVSTAWLHSAHLHFRMGSYRKGLAALRRGATLHPRNLLSPKPVRVVFNILFNRIGHQLLWTLRRAFGRERRSR